MFINRAKALAKQCIQLDKNIEDFELKMYIINKDFDLNMNQIFESWKLK